jgi:hypothetical protein
LSKKAGLEDKSVLTDESILFLKKLKCDAKRHVIEHYKSI